MGGGQTSANQYADEANSWAEKVGQLQWAAIQDWMCEPFILAKTGKGVHEHQRRTIDSWHRLKKLAPAIPWVPVLQGWEYDDYLIHVEMYQESGTVLADEPLVGLGSVCRRQATGVVEDLIRELWSRGIKLHGFGFKLRGLANVAAYLRSADSMAWSLDARRKPPLTGCQHGNCANCLKFALQWRLKVLAVITHSADSAASLDTIRL